jgi:hypothetical protein
MFFIEQLKWITYKPLHFKCFICLEKEATKKLYISNDGVVVKMCICQECADLGEKALLKIIFKH